MHLIFKHLNHDVEVRKNVVLQVDGTLWYYIFQNVVFSDLQFRQDGIDLLLPVPFLLPSPSLSTTINAENNARGNQRKTLKSELVRDPRIGGTI